MSGNTDTYDQISHVESLDIHIRRISYAIEDISFPQNLLEIREYASGYRGVFAKDNIDKNTILLSLKRNGNALSVFKAYEEVLPLIRKLEKRRFDIDSVYILSLALYQRALNSNSSNLDPFLAGVDLNSAFSGNIISVSNAPFTSQLNFPNSFKELEKSRNISAFIQELELDEELFRVSLASVVSRRWDFGMLPYFDLFNSSYLTDENMVMRSNDVSDGDIYYTFRATKKVNKGEELKWNYNKNDALNTWFKYGYLSKLRRFPARIAKIYTPAEYEKLSKVIKYTFKASSDVLCSNRINKHLVNMSLYCPGPDFTDEKFLSNEIFSMVKIFNSIVGFFRLSELVKESPAEVCPEIYPYLQGTEFNKGPDFEAKVILSIHNALEEGNKLDLILISNFEKHNPNKDIDLKDLHYIMEYSSKTWKEILQTLLSICQAKSLIQCIPTLQSALRSDSIKDHNIKDVIHHIDKYNPSLMSSLVKQYLASMKFI